MIDDLISRQAAMKAIGEKPSGYTDWDLGCLDQWKWNIEALKTLPSAEPERKTVRLSNQEWIDFLVEQFEVSRTTAKSMLHAMMQGKREDNFKKQFSGAKMTGE